MSEINLTQEFDASVWVDEWMKAIKNDRSIATSEGTMLGWFANAIMAGYDKARAERDEWRKDAEMLAEDCTAIHEQLRWRSVTEEPETGQWVFVSRGRTRFADIFVYNRALSDSFMRYDLWLPIPPQQFGYFPDCPITLHRELVEKYGKEMK